MNESTWYFFGFPVSAEESDRLHRKAAMGFCPFCDRQVSEKYGAKKKHMRVCGIKHGYDHLSLHREDK